MQPGPQPDPLLLAHRGWPILGGDIGTFLRRQRQGFTKQRLRLVGHQSILGPDKAAQQRLDPWSEGIEPPLRERAPYLEAGNGWVYK